MAAQHSRGSALTQVERLQSVGHTHSVMRFGPSRCSGNTRAKGTELSLGPMMGMLKNQANNSATHAALLGMNWVTRFAASSIEGPIGALIGKRGIRSLVTAGKGECAQHVPTVTHLAGRSTQNPSPSEWWG
jgi:hypothetical protein